MRPVLAAALLALAALGAMPSAHAAAQPCSDRDLVGSGDNGVHQNADCSLVVSNKPYDCVWGGHWTEWTVGPVTCRSYSCSPPSDAS